MQRLKQDMNIGNNLRDLRHKAGLTQEQVAAKLQTWDLTVTRSIYGQMEAGEYNIRISELLAMKKLFKAEYEDFFRGLEFQIPE